MAFNKRLTHYYNIFNRKKLQKHNLSIDLNNNKEISTTKTTNRRKKLQKKTTNKNIIILTHSCCSKIHFKNENLNIFFNPQ